MKKVLKLIAILLGIGIIAGCKNTPSKGWCRWVTSGIFCVLILNKYVISFLWIWYDKVVNEFVFKTNKKDRRDKMMKVRKILFACLIVGFLFMFLLLKYNPRNNRAYLENRIERKLVVFIQPRIGGSIWTVSEWL